MWMSNSRSDGSSRRVSGRLLIPSLLDNESAIDLLELPIGTLTPQPQFELGIDLELQEPNQSQIHSNPPIKSSNPNPHQASIQPGALNRPRSNKITGDSQEGE